MLDTWPQRVADKPAEASMKPRALGRFAFQVFANIEQASRLRICSLLRRLAFP